MGVGMRMAGLVTFGRIWLYLVIFGYIWLYLVIFGYIWLYLAIFGYVWKSFISGSLVLLRLKW